MAQPRDTHHSQAAEEELTRNPADALGGHAEGVRLRLLDDDCQSDPENGCRLHPEESAPARAIRHLLETATWPRAGGGPYETTVVIAYRRALPVPVQPDIRHDDGIAEAAPPPDWPPRPNE